MGFLKNEKEKVEAFFHKNYNSVDETGKSLDEMADEMILVIAPATLNAGFQFMADLGDGEQLLVTVPHDVKEGEQFHHPRRSSKNPTSCCDDEDKTKKARSSFQDNLLCNVVCCCQAAPCCFPDGCCPDGCCPDGCCPNGNCGEQFEGCCFHYDFTKSNALQFAREQALDGGGSKPNVGLRQLLQALLDSNSSTPSLAVAGIRGAVASAKKQQEENAKKNDHHHENMANQSNQNKKKFQENMKEAHALAQAKKDGVISAKVADLKIRKIFGLSTDTMASKNAVEYPLGGCCNYAPCLFPDGCCPDGCCPDGCCPNGCIGEQFKGCCMSIKGRPPWDSYAASSFGPANNGRVNSNVAFVAMVDAIVNNDDDASDEEICHSLRHLLNAISEGEDDDENDDQRRSSIYFSALNGEDSGDSASMRGGCTIM